MKLLTSLVQVIKASPIKSAAVVLGTSGVIAGTVYAVKKYRNRPDSIDAAVASVANVDAVAAATAGSEDSIAAAQAVLDAANKEAAKTKKVVKA